MQEILKRYNINAKKALGQNFLIDEKVLENISSISHIEWENILEIWPWFWVLTKLLCEKKPRSLTLVELDKDMVNILEDRIEKKEINTNNIDFEILNEDVLKITPKYKKYKIIANIPYYITSPILFKFLYEVKNIPEEMIILMQKEVWERIIWTKKQKTKSSVLSLFVQKKCTVEEKIIVTKEKFFPSPKVDSIVLFFKYKRDFEDIDDNLFLALIKAAFSNPRKKMIKNLENFWYEKKLYLEKLQKIWFWENTRPEELKIEDYIFLLK